jgi:hypothetical protein
MSAPFLKNERVKVSFLMRRGLATTTTPFFGGAYKDGFELLTVFLQLPTRLPGLGCY